MDSELVTGPDGGLVDITISDVQPPDVDPRIIGTYNGDGSMVNVDKSMRSSPGLLGVIVSGIFIGGVTFFVISLIQILLNSDYTSSQIRNVGIISSVVALLAMVILLFGYWHFITAKLRFGITADEATYWQNNMQLRKNCRPPHSRAEFHALLQLAQELDREKAPAFIAEQTANYFARLVDERGLWRRKASSSWLGPIVLQGILDAQHPGNDPDDEMSGASEQ